MSDMNIFSPTDILYDMILLRDSEEYHTCHFSSRISNRDEIGRHRHLTFKLDGI